MSSGHDLASGGFKQRAVPRATDRGCLARSPPCCTPHEPISPRSQEAEEREPLLQLREAVGLCSERCFSGKARLDSRFHPEGEQAGSELGREI